MADEKTYLIEFENRKRQRVTVPASWYVTFGPAVAGFNNGKANGYQGRIPMAVRFYESEKKQRAIFTDVVGFRDLSIKVEEERINTQEKHGYMECDGKRKATMFQAQTKEWVNPDEIVEQPKQLQESTKADFSDDPVDVNELRFFGGVQEQGSAEEK